MDLSQDGLRDVLEELLATYPQHRTQLISEARAMEAPEFCQYLVAHGLSGPDYAAVILKKIESLATRDMKSTVAGNFEKEGRPENSAALRFNPDQLNRFLTTSGTVKLGGQLFANKYLIVREIGRGGMGLVLEAENVQTRTRLALKLCLADEYSIEEANRFKREAQILAQLDHPNIVQVNEYGHDNGVPFYTMELLKGWAFGKEVESALDETGAGLDLDRVVECLAPIADALSYCHEKGVIHRDVKPDNVFIEAKTGRPVLIDFGIVKRDPKSLGKTLDGLSLSLTEAGTVLGTPAFMSPEQLDPKHFGEISAAADVWGLGATIFYGLTGVAPVPGGSLINIFNAVLSGNIYKIRDLVPTIPKWFEALYQQVMLRDPEQRLTMFELHATLVQEGMTQDAPRRSWFLGGVIVVVLTALCLLYLSRSSQPALEFRIGDHPKWTSEAGITLRGTTRRRVIFMASRDATVLYRSKNLERSFVLPIVLREGLNEFSITIHDSSGELISKIVVTLTRDTEAPRLKFISKENLLLAPKERVLVLDRRGQIGLELIESSPFEVYLGKEKLENRNGKLFTTERRGRKEKVERLRVVDKAGNETIEEVLVLGASDVEKRTRAYEILTDWTNYEKASEAETDYLFDCVSKLLSPQFKALSPKVFRCGGKQFRIQSYLHVTSRVYFRLVPGGLFTLGIRDVDTEFTRALELDKEFRREWVTHATPAQRVRVSPMLVAATELSHGQWLSVFDKDDLNETAVDFPMAGVPWTMVQDWLKKAGDGFRLPSEAEWEYATRAGTRTRFFWGDRVDLRYMVCRPTQGKEGKKVTGRISFPNAFGLVDTLGNLWEFCEDSYVDNYSGQSLTAAPQRRNHSQVSRRGGSFTYFAADCQVWTRSLGFEKTSAN
ncbi:MAG: bifunctional serine/threonine-protein kinase/formylglycine-generating enzyme family protein, partial [Planctomycetota bacterium]|nr:bifunctional serine/threonine-protein kinase/formylglycine-generating enzyme family protein [Planctomycetota bacterium]